MSNNKAEATYYDPQGHNKKKATLVDLIYFIVALVAAVLALGMVLGVAWVLLYYIITGNYVVLLILLGFITSYALVLKGLDYLFRSKYEEV